MESKKINIIRRNKELWDIFILKDKDKQTFNNYCHTSNIPPPIILLSDNKQNPWTKNHNHHLEQSGCTLLMDFLSQWQGWWCLSYLN